MSRRIRSIKPDWLEDERLLRAGSDARVLSVALILMSDDYGRGRLIPEVMCAEVFPFEEKSSRVFRESLARLSDVGFVGVYDVRGQRYFAIRNWTKHQKVDKPGKPQVPEPLDGFATLSRDSRETLEPDWIGRDRKGEEELHNPPHAHASTREHMRDDVSLLRVGMDWMQAFNPSAFWDVGKWRVDLETIGAFPAAQRELALATVQADEWCRANDPNPGHFVKYWPKYARGKPAVTQVVPKRAFGPTLQDTEGLAADAAGRLGAWET